MPEQIQGTAQAPARGGDHREADGVLQEVQQDVLPISGEGFWLAGRLGFFLIYRCNTDLIND